MNDIPTAHTQHYEIRLKGHLDAQWATWFHGLAITLEEGGDTLLFGPVPDQAALHGLLRKVRDLGIPLVSINQIGSNEIHNSSPMCHSEEQSDEESPALTSTGRFGYASE